MAFFNGNRNQPSAPNYQGAGAFGFEKLSTRQFVIMFLVVVAAIVFVGKLFYMQVIDAPNKVAEAQATRDTSRTLLAHRGTIYDRNGNILATSIEVKSVYCDPTLVSDLQEQAECLVQVLGGNF